MRFRAPFALLFALTVVAVLLFFPACSGHTSGAGVSKIVVAPTVVSASRGDVVSLTLSAEDAAGGAISADFNFISQNPALATVNPAGQVCAGSWDKNGVVCTPATQTGQTTLVITPQRGSATATVTVFVHEKVDGMITNEPTGCTSSTQVTNVTATAFSNDPVACANLGATAPCTVPASTLGPLTWAAVNPSVVTFNNSLNNAGVATASIPGVTQIYASIGSLHSPAVDFTTCPIVTLLQCTSTPCTAPPTSNTFSLATSGTQALYAEAIDSKGAALVSPGITWISTNNYAIVLSETSSTTTTTPATTLAYTATGEHAGAYSTIFTSCVSPSCNIGLAPVYSNSLTGQVTGSPAATIFAASTKSLTVVPINLSDNSLGTVATLNHVPTSALISRQGGELVFGADSGGVMLLGAGATTSTAVSFNGKPLAFSPNGESVLISDAPNKLVYLLNLTNTSSALAITAPNGATGGGFSPDSATVWFTDGTDTLYTYNSYQGLLTFTLPAPAVDVEFVANGPIAYVAGGAANAIPLLSFCTPDPLNPSHPVVDSVTAVAPTLVRAIPDGSGAVALDLPNLRVINTSNVSQTCPPTATDTESVVALPNGSALNVADVSSFFVTPDSSKAVVISQTGVVDVVGLSGGTVTTITPTGTPANIYPGGPLSDGSFLFIGASDGNVHKIDLTSNTDTTQINPKLTDTSGATTYPDLVAVSPK